jgi:hypothetical protein
MGQQISRITFILTVLLLSSCKKVPVILPDWPQDGGCEAAYSSRTKEYEQVIFKLSFPYCPIPVVNTITNDIIIHEPLINPSNPFEFLFLRRSKGGSPYHNELCIYNFCENNLRILYESVAFHVDWSVTGWIIFTGHDGQLRRIKSDGSDLTQLTYSGSNDRSRWSPDGSKYLYADGSFNPSQKRISYMDGSLYKTLDFPMTTWDWLTNDEIIYTIFSNGSLSVRKYDLITEQHSPLGTIESASGGVRVSRDKVFISTLRGVYELFDNQLVLRDSNYQTFSASNVHAISDNHLLMLRSITDTSGFAHCKVSSTLYISLFNIHTGTERWINLPE